MMTLRDEENMVDFLRENPMMWNTKMTDYRHTHRKGRLWEEQAARLGKPTDLLLGWYRSIKDHLLDWTRRRAVTGPRC